MIFIKHTVSIVIVVFGIILIRTQDVNAQNTALRFKNLTIEDGLPQNKVDCMLQDQFGFLWFGTWNGLCRYDGYDFEVFDVNQTSKKNLRSNFIHALTNDAFGNIWIGTKEGLFVYIQKSEKMKKTYECFFIIAEGVE